MVAQRHTHTATNRYPGLFRTVARWLADHRTVNERPLRILSFGCSSGEEMLSLRAYFPEATIIGCDTSIEMLRQSKRTLRGDDGFTFYSTPQNIDAFGPFDAIFAMSVLCQYPDSQKVDNLKPVFPFTLFETLAGNLANNVKPGGVFCLFNSNYLLRDLPQADEFVSLRSQHIHTTGFIDRFAPDGRRLTHSMGNRDAFVQTALPKASLDDDDLIDCLHIRKSAKVDQSQYVNVGLAREPSGWEAIDEEVSSPKELVDIAGSGSVASRLVRDQGRDANGQFWRRSSWHKSTLKGEIIRFPFWFEPTDKVHNRDLSDVQSHVLDESDARIASSGALVQRLLRKVRLK